MQLNTEHNPNGTSDPLATHLTRPSDGVSSRKRRILAILSLAIGTLLASSLVGTAAAQDGRITLEVTSLEGGAGAVLCGLYRESDAQGFPMDPSAAWKNARRVVSAAREARMTLTFDGVPAGRYAISCMHDEDDDGSMRTGMFGIPKEGWAVSRNASPSMRAPRFDEAVVDFDGSRASLRVRMQY